MQSKKILGKVLKYKWEPWLERQMPPFTTSFSVYGTTREFCLRQGIDCECRAILFQQGFWYRSEEIMEEMADMMESYFAKNRMKDLIAKVNSFYKTARKRIIALAKENKDPLTKLREAYDIMSTAFMFIWITHGIEVLFDRKIKKAVPKYIKGDVNEFISKAAIHKGKTTLAKMEAAAWNGISARQIAKDFKWLKCRTILDQPYTAKDIDEWRKSLIKPIKQAPVKIPPALKPLVEDVAGMIYLRTLRTDIMYELLFLARPIFEQVAEHCNLSIKQLNQCTIMSLLEGKPQQYVEDYAMASYRSDYFYSNKPLVREPKHSRQTVIGTIANKGIAQGIVKVVLKPEEIHKVNKGDILVTQMTFPAYIAAMQKAAAFVTDEGGITCHAAIVSREMNKPCIISTKNGTRLLKDGDLVEVDANKGVVRKLK